MERGKDTHIDVQCRDQHAWFSYFHIMATRIYTKTGDSGTTGLFGGTRVSKDHARIEAYGTIDELNAILGVVLAYEVPEHVRAELTVTMSDLFTLGADLATPLEPAPVYPIPRIGREHIDELERRIDLHDEELEPLKAFILPGGHPAAAHLHVARTVCRRAERTVVRLAAEDNIGDFVLRYCNRLSDYLFTAARVVNACSGRGDVPWKPGRPSV